MSLTFLNQPWPYLAVAAFAAIIGWYVWTQPRRPGTRYFVWSVVIWFVWAAAAALLVLVRSPGLRFGLWSIQCFCALLEAPFELFFSIEYTGNGKWLIQRGLYLVFLPAFLFLIIAFSLPGALIASEYHFGFEALIGRDPIRWGFYLYIVALIVINLAVLITSLLRAPAFWAPILLIIIGRIVPTIAFILLDPQHLPVLPIQATILFGGFAMLLYFIALYNFGLLRVMPVARDMAISHMPYGLLVFDAENRLVDFNPAARALPNLPLLPERPGNLAWRQISTYALGDWWEKLSLLIRPEPVFQDVTVHTASVDRILRVISLPLIQTSGWRMGQVFLLEDVTETRLAQRQQAQALWAQATLEERGQLANELHDGISQSLAFLNLQSQAAQVYLQTGQAQAAQISLGRLSEAIGEIQAETRELIGNMLSVSQPAENFCDSLTQIVSGFEQQTGLAVHLEFDLGPHDQTETACDLTRLSPPLAVQLIRITQEALANIRKHAYGVSQVSVLLKVHQGQLWLTIADDGPGFDLASLRTNGKHFGLQVMQQRAARVGGQIMIESTPGEGAQINVHVPLELPSQDNIAWSGK
jgi:signal transduction histidine kinase